LHFAAGCGHIEIVKLLLERGADREAVDKEGRTPLKLTKEIKPNNCDAIVALIEH